MPDAAAEHDHSPVDAMLRADAAIPAKGSGSPVSFIRRAQRYTAVRDSLQRLVATKFSADSNLAGVRKRIDVND
jgi:hypothetical protein